VPVRWVGSADVTKQFEASIKDGTGDSALVCSLSDCQI